MWLSIKRTPLLESLVDPSITSVTLSENLTNIADFLCFTLLSSSPSEGTPAIGSYGCTPQSLPKFQHPSHELLKENGFTQHVYHKYRRRCLNGKLQIWQLKSTYLAFRQTLKIL